MIANIGWQPRVSWTSHSCNHEEVVYWLEFDFQSLSLRFKYSFYYFNLGNQVLPLAFTLRTCRSKTKYTNVCLASANDLVFIALFKFFKGSGCMIMRVAIIIYSFECWDKDNSSHPIYCSYFFLERRIPHQSNNERSQQQWELQRQHTTISLKESERPNSK